MRRAVWGLPQQVSLPKNSYANISGVKYVGNKHADHLIWRIKKKYKRTKDSVRLNWDHNAQTLNIFMPSYIRKFLLKYKHRVPTKPQHCFYSPLLKQYGAKVQHPLLVNISPKLSLVKIKEIHCVISSILYYARTVDITVLMAFSSIAIEQTKGTTNTMEKTKQLLDYIATNLDGTILFHSSNMIMKVHLDASYLSKSDVRSHACGHFFMGWSPKDGNHIKLNGACFTLCAILCFVVASTAEAKSGVLFLNRKEGMIIRLSLKELGHPQPKTHLL
jgi:hypothetical protein